MAEQLPPRGGHQPAGRYRYSVASPLRPFMPFVLTSITPSALSNSSQRQTCIGLKDKRSAALEQLRKKGESPEARCSSRQSETSNCNLGSSAYRNASAGKSAAAARAKIGPMAVAPNGT